MLVTSGERGLCGAFNANVLRRAFDFLREKSDKSMEVITIAKKSRDAFRKRALENRRRVCGCDLARRTRQGPGNCRRSDEDLRSAAAPIPSI